LPLEVQHPASISRHCVVQPWQIARYFSTLKAHPLGSKAAGNPGTVPASGISHAGRQCVPHSNPARAHRGASGKLDRLSVDERGVDKVLSMSVSAKLWVVIPAYNEGEVIARVVSGARASYEHIVVVDDCSNDGTSAAALAAGAIVLRHAINLGAGAATQTGMRYALDRGAEYIVALDADGQHQFEDIAVLLDRQRETAADVVIGSRSLGKVEGMPLMRRVVMRLAVIFTLITSGVRVSDPHNGFRLLTRRAAELIRIRQNRYAFCSEILDCARDLGLKITEAPVTVLYTEYSLRKGQRLTNAVQIIWDLFLARLNK
jgi:polyprenyl-phospho-N-acetylgalactosaminyl synthase